MGNMVSGKHLNFEMSFQANTSQAKKEIQELQNTLDKAINSFNKSSGNGDSAIAKQLRQASSAAVELKKHIESAMDPKTGKLDLSALQKSFQSMNRDASYFKENIGKAGEAGKAAFSAFSNSVLKAEVPLKRTNTLLQEFGTTLKNTARWQISSSILHGFMGSVQSAYHYAEDLNKSLNNIRIVTGQNADQMASFAKQANEAAKALSTTTTKYTDAALIYYQQGLNDKQVKERTDVTVKMANVARESAEEVSNQMTAVWNNFNKDGSAAAESFADKMTALGAATASSTSEIAEGLSKFAGIADTIGLSFDYATSALATVTATSRESADVVGTAFKTIFARMEGLKQGNTDEDGTDLNKYSQGLAKIGVSIKDQEGALKSMDQILDEVGDKWQGLARDQKIATAQTVAGVRQYNQLMTLMDNWDFFQKNLATAQNSGGTLQEQADIYAESWEAARDRVTAAAEEIYSQLINDDFFIDLNNAFAGFLGIISDAIDGLGGLKGVLLGIGSIVTKVFGKEIISTLGNLFSTDNQRMKAWANQQNAALDARAALGNEDTPMADEAYEGVKAQNEKMLAIRKQLSSEQKEQLMTEAALHKERVSQLETLEKEQATLREMNKESEKRVATAKANKDKAIDNSVVAESSRLQARKGIINKEDIDATKFGEAEQEYVDFATKVIEKTGSIDRSTKEGAQAFKDLQESLNGNTEAAIRYAEALDKVVQTEHLLKQAETEVTQAEQQHEATEEAYNKKTTEVNNMDIQVRGSGKDLDNMMADPDKNLPTPPKGFADKFAGMTEAVMGFGMALSSITGIMDQFGQACDGTISWGEFFISTITGIGMALPMVISGVHALTAAFGSMSAAAPWLLAIGAAIGAITLALSIFTGPSSLEVALQDATEAAKGLQDQYEATKESYDNLKSSLEDYNSARDALDHMVAGTQEWRDAVEEVNQKVYDLMETFPELAAEVQNVNGVLEISQEGQQKALDLQTERMNTNREGMLGAQIAKNDASEELFKEKYSFDGMDRLIELYEAQGSAIFSSEAYLREITGYSADTVKSILDNRTTYEKGIQEVIAGRQQSDTNAKELIGEALQKQSANMGKANREAFESFATGSFKDTLEESIHEHADSTSGSMNDDEIQEWYRAKMGFESVKNLDDNQGEYRKANGETVTIDDSVARDLKATLEAVEDFDGELKNLKQTFENVQDIISKVTGASKEMSSNIILALQGQLDYSKLTKKELEELKKLLDPNQALGADEEQSKKVMGLLGLDMDDAEDRETFDKKKEDARKEIDNIDFPSVVSNMVESVREAYKKIPKDDLSLQGAQVIAGIMNKSFADGGAESLEKFNKVLGEAEAAGKLDEFGTMLKDIPWEDTSVKDFRDKIAEIGINSQASDEYIQSLIDSMNNMNTSMADAIQLTSQQYGEIHKIIDELNIGDVISEDDFNKLAEINAETDQYFTKMLDGTYKLTGDAEEFYQATQKNLIDKASDAIDAGKERASDLQAVKDRQSNSIYNWNTLSQSQGGVYEKGEFTSTTKFENLQAQLEIVKALGDQTDETRAKINQWAEDIDGLHFSDTEAEELAEAVRGCEDAYNNLDEAIAANNYEMNQQYLAIAMSAQTLGELDELLKSHTITQEAYNEALLNMHNEERMEDLDPKEVAEYGEFLQELAESEEDATLGGEKLSKDLAKNADAAKDISVQISRMNHGVDELSQNWGEWSSILKKSSKGSQEYFKASQSTKKALADLFDVSEDYISLDLVDSFANDSESMALMEKAAKGDGEAIDELRQKALEDIIVHMEIDKEGFTNEDLASEVTNLQKMLDDMGPITAGTELSLDGMNAGEKDFVEALNNMIAAAGLSKDKVNTLLSGLGFTANYASKPQEVMVKEPDKVQTHHRITGMKTVAIGSGIPGEGDQGYATEWDEETTTTTIPGKTHKGSVDAYSMETSAPGTTVVPKINSVTKKAPPSANNSSPQNAGGKKPGGGGKKGGGGNKKGKVQREKKKYKNEFDRYWQLNQTLDKVAHSLNLLGKAQDYTFGKERAKNIQKQNAELQNQLKAIKDLRKEQKKELKELQGVRQKRKDKKGKTHWKEVGKINKKGYVVDKKGKKTGVSKKYGARFDEDGYLANYDEITKAQLKKYNAAEKAWAKAQKKGPTKKQKKAWNKAKKEFEAFQEWLDRIKALTQDELQDSLEQQQDTIRQFVENNIAAWQATIEFDIDIRKGERTWKKFLNKISKGIKAVTGHAITDVAGDIKLNAKDVKGVYNDLFGNGVDHEGLIAKRQQYVDIYNDWDNYEKNTPENERIASSKSEALKMINELGEQIQSEFEEAGNDLAEGWDTYLEAIESAAEANEYLNEQLKRQGDILDYNREIIELYYGDEAYDQMAKYYTAEKKYLKAQAAGLQAQYNSWNEQFEAAKAAAEARGEKIDLNDIRTWSEDMVKIDEKRNACADELRDTNLEIAKILKEEYLNSINEIIKKYDKLNSSAVESVAENWERAKQSVDEYLDSTEKTYQVQSLMNKFNNSIDATKDINAQKKLAALRDKELKSLKEKGELTKYDLDAANARYDIALKEIALEEAQNNKNSMKLVRDQQGNWTYQYVADQDDVRQKQQELADSVYNWYEESKQGLIQVNEELQSLEEWKNEQLRDLVQKTSLSEEDRQAKEKIISDTYLKRREELTKKSNKYQLDMATTSAKMLKTQYDTDKASFETLNEDKKDIIKSFTEEGIKDFADLYDKAGGFAKDGADTMIKALISDPEGAIPQIVSTAYNRLLKDSDGLGEIFSSLSMQILNEWTKDDGGSVKAEMKEMLEEIDGKAKEYQENMNDYLVTGPNSVSNNWDTVNGYVDTYETKVTGVIQTTNNSLEQARLAVAALTGEYDRLLKKLNETVVNNPASNVNMPNADEQENPTSEQKPPTTQKPPVQNTTTKKSAQQIQEDYWDAEYAKNYTMKEVYKKSNGTMLIVAKDKKTKKWNLIDISKDGGVSSVSCDYKSYDQLMKEEKIDSKIKKGTILDEAEFKNQQWSYAVYDTGGYTGDWQAAQGIDGKGGRFALLHQKELVLNKEDTSNILDAVNAVRDIKSLNASITDTISQSITTLFAEGIKNAIGNKILDKQDEEKSITIENITAEFPNAQDVDDIREAIMSLPRLASQYASRNLK